MSEIKDGEAFEENEKTDGDTAVEDQSTTVEENADGDTAVEDQSTAVEENALPTRSKLDKKAKHETGDSRVKRAKKERKKSTVGWIYCFVFAAAIAVVLRLFVIELYLVKGASMEPTLVENNRVFVEKVSKIFSLPNRNDIVIVHAEGEEDSFVKRVIALPGETVEIRDGYVYIDGQKFEEDVYEEQMLQDMAPITVPEDSVFVLGDNRNMSKDSRDPSIGTITSEEIIGVVWFTIG